MPLQWEVKLSLVQDVIKGLLSESLGFSVRTLNNAKDLPSISGCAGHNARTRTERTSDYLLTSNSSHWNEYRQDEERHMTLESSTQSTWKDWIEKMILLKKPSYLWSLTPLTLLFCFVLALSCDQKIIQEVQISIQVGQTISWHLTIPLGAQRCLDVGKLW